MTDFFYIEPEVAGGLGEHTVMDVSIHPPMVSRLHLQFDGWLGDVLLESFPCFVVTVRAADALVAAGLSGFELGPVETTTSDTFGRLYPDRLLPALAWLKPTGAAGRDDFGLAPDGRLMTSKRATELLRTLGVDNALIELFAERPA